MSWTYLLNLIFLKEKLTSIFRSIKKNCFFQFKIHSLTFYQFDWYRHICFPCFLCWGTKWLLKTKISFSKAHRKMQTSRFVKFIFPYSYWNFCYILVLNNFSLLAIISAWYSHFLKYFLQCLIKILQIYVSVAY